MAETARVSPFAVFRNRNFSLMWTGQLISTMGSAQTYSSTGRRKKGAQNSVSASPMKGLLNTTTHSAASAISVTTSAGENDNAPTATAVARKAGRSRRNAAGR
jgi:hypothetical protein